MPSGPPTSSCRGTSGTGAPSMASGWSMRPPRPPMATVRPGSRTTRRLRRSKGCARSICMAGPSTPSTSASRAPSRTRQPHPPQWVGLKFFNVYGPNEYHKGGMISVVKVKHDEVAAGGAGAAVPLHRARPGRRRAAARLHLDRRRGRCAAVAARYAGGERAVQRRHRPGAHLSGPRQCGVRRGRRAAQHRVHRHAGGAARPVPVVHRGRHHPAAHRRLSRASSRRSRKACGAMCRIT